MNAEQLASSNVNLENSIVFSAGCHSGYNIVGNDAVPGVTQTLDWVGAFAQKQATLIAGTGYQYGDTDFLAYSEQLYADFSHALRYGTGPGRGRRRARRRQEHLPRRHPERPGDRHQVAARGDAVRAADAQRRPARRPDPAADELVDRRLDDAGSLQPGRRTRPQLDRHHALAEPDDQHDTAGEPERRLGADGDLPERTRRRRDQPGRADAAARQQRRQRVRRGPAWRGLPRRHLHRPVGHHAADGRAQRPSSAESIRPSRRARSSPRDCGRSTTSAGSPAERPERS